jgi:helicase MOV-10
MVKHVAVQPDKWYEGRVHQVNVTSLDLKFCSDFSLYTGKRVDVMFRLNRVPTRRMHQALTTSFTPARILFPASEHLDDISPVTREQLAAVDPLDAFIKDDEEQVAAIAAILNHPRGAPPFVIFGPWVYLCYRIYVFILLGFLDPARGKLSL